MHIVRSSRDYAVISVEGEWYRVGRLTLDYLKAGRDPGELGLDPMTDAECEDESNGREE